MLQISTQPQTYKSICQVCWCVASSMVIKVTMGIAWRPEKTALQQMCDVFAIAKPGVDKAVGAGACLCAAVQQLQRHLGQLKRPRWVLHMVRCLRVKSWLSMSSVSVVVMTTFLCNRTVLLAGVYQTSRVLTEASGESTQENICSFVTNTKY
jgi:hypothetical protein